MKNDSTKLEIFSSFKFLAVVFHFYFLDLIYEHSRCYRCPCGVKDNQR